MRVGYPNQKLSFCRTRPHIFGVRHLTDLFAFPVTARCHHTLDERCNRRISRTFVTREQLVSTQEELAISYDVSNDFFRLWLDKRMNYSCALFYPETKTLEEAQTNKLRW